MEFTNPFAPSRREISLSSTRIMDPDPTTKAVTRFSRRPISRDNFSYPRLSRHESNESRSSDGSVPGMTDTSDSDISFDDDGIYNSSAGELWDSFWPESNISPTTRLSQEQHLALLQSRHRGDGFMVNLASGKQSFDADSDNRKVEALATPSLTFQSPPSQYTPKKSTPTYSIYPKIPEISVQRLPHPPRTSSLSFEPPSPPQRPLFLRGSRSSAALHSSKSSHNINRLFIAPSLASSNRPASRQRSATTAKTAASVPVSPAYPPPPPPKTLRASASAFSLRDMARIPSNNQKLASHNVTAPLAPLLPSPLPEPLPTTRPQVERFVSVFEFDSDSEADVDEGKSFAKRITRGLKRSGGGKRGVAERKVVTARLGSLDAGASSKDHRERPRSGDSLSRKRGGSLGRIFGLMGR